MTGMERTMYLIIVLIVTLVVLQLFDANGGEGMWLQKFGLFACGGLFSRGIRL